MRLWTIQPVNVWQQIQTAGFAHVDELHMHGGVYVPPSYEWLVVQLARRRKWNPNRLPWWCYCAKPDLRSHRHYCVGRQVRLELEVACERAFVMPCWAWNRVYCQDYLALTELEQLGWTDRMLSSVPLDPDLPNDRIPIWPLPEPWMSELRISWERLFDPRLPSSGLNWGCIDLRSEAVIQDIRLEDVRTVTEFSGVLPQRFRRRTP